MRDNVAQGRLPGEPIAIVDIGSNSVRLVAYELHSRAPTPTFNEKALCGLGRGVATTGLLPEDAVAKALAALERFRVLCETMRIDDVRSIATAAVRDASNGPKFLSLAERAIGCRIELLSGYQEARLSALGVVSSIHNADGVVGDLGGGSLELTDVRNDDAGYGLTLPLGGLSLMDLSERSPKKAAKIVRETLSGVKLLQGLSGRSFYAVGGTWRALARLHMRQRQYPMNVMHNYVIPSRDALDFARLVERIEAEALLSIEAVSSARRPLLAYGAAVLEEIIRQANPKEIVISALGVREGLLYSQLPFEAQAQDPLIASAWEFNRLRSRAPEHGEELFGWTSRLMASTHLEEDEEDRRLRHAACLLSDISWRAHPDYRGTQAYDLVANAAFIGVDHPFPRLSRAGCRVPPFVQRRLRDAPIAFASERASTRSGAHSRGGNAGRLQHLRRHAGDPAARSLGLRAGPGGADAALRSRASQQRTAPIPDASVRSSHRRRCRNKEAVINTC